MLDYTQTGDIVRGSRWPPADDNAVLTLTKSSGWVGADGWDWSLLLSRTRRGGSVDLTLTADSASLDGNVITLEFHADDDETEALPAGKGRYYVEVKSDNAGDVSFYDCVAGTANVRDAAGEG